MGGGDMEECTCGKQRRTLVDGHCWRREGGGRGSGVGETRTRGGGGSARRTISRHRQGGLGEGGGEVRALFRAVCSRVMHVSRDVSARDRTHVPLIFEVGCVFRIRAG